MHDKSDAQSGAIRAGFIGLGDQGFPMAANLLADNGSLAAFDLKPSRVAALEKLGGTGAASAAEIARVCDIICVCVFDGSQLEQVVCGNGGILETAMAGAIIVVHGTVGPDVIQQLDVEAGKRAVRLVDAPVAGGPAGAVGRSLLYMVGGDDEPVRSCLPLFEPSARHIVRTGPTGSGMRAKAIHQMILLSNMAAAYDGYTLGAAWGLPADAIAAVVANGGAQSRIADRWPSLSLPVHAADLFRKDIDLSIEAAAELGVDLVVAPHIRTKLDRVISNKIQKLEEKI